MRNLNKAEINGRMLKVDFASDNKNGTNLKEEDVKYRDWGEVVNPKGDYMNPAEATVEDILNSLSIEQEQLLLFGIKDAYAHMEKVGDFQAIDNMVESLAQDEALLDNLVSMVERVQSLQGGPQYMAQGGIFHYQPQQHNAYYGV